MSLSDCVFDLCAEEGSAALRCASFEAYATACQEAGVELGSWRKQLDCGKMLNTQKVTLHPHHVGVTTVELFSVQEAC